MKQDCITILAVFLIGVVFVSGCTTGNYIDDTSFYKTYTVTYKVTGLAEKASLTYTNAQGGTEQRTVRLPWQTTFTVDEGEFLYISAQNEGEYGSVNTEIMLDGSVWKKSSSYSAYKIATSSGTVGRK